MRTGGLMPPRWTGVCVLAMVLLSNDGCSMNVWGVTGNGHAPHGAVLVSVLRPL